MQRCLWSKHDIKPYNTREIKAVSLSGGGLIADFQVREASVEGCRQNRSIRFYAKPIGKFASGGLHGGRYAIG